MNAVGIDVSKGKSMVAVLRPMGEVIAKPYEVIHTTGELDKLARSLKALPEETRVILEHTGRYYELWLSFFIKQVSMSVRSIHV